MRMEIFLSNTSSESESFGISAFVFAGSRCVVAILTNSSAARNMVENNLLKLSTSKIPPISLGDSDMSSNEDRRAMENVRFEILFGILGSLVRSNLDPPNSTGTLTDVRGSLNLASPRLGTTTIAISPRSIISSGIMDDAVSESRES